MKEFEKFWNKYWLSYSSYVGSEQHLAKVIWKAALEWALEQETWIGPDDGGEWGIDKWEIEEELNAKT